MKRQEIPTARDLVRAALEWLAVVVLLGAMGFFLTILAFWNL